MPITNVYTDGSCLNNQKSKKGQSYGGYGGYIEYSNGEIEEYSAGLSGNKITNNIGEFMAFKYALQRMIEIKTRDIIHVYTDSSYLINTYTKWAREWETNGWKKANGKDIENVELVQEIYTTLNDSKLICIFKKVKAHEDEPDKNSSKWKHWYGNNRADALAVSCSKDMLQESLDTDHKENKEKKPKKVSKKKVPDTIQESFPSDDENY